MKSGRGLLRSLVRAIVIASCTIAFGLMAMGVLRLFVIGNGPQNRDAISYWTAAHLFAQHRDPYDVAATAEIEHSLGLGSDTREIIMRNPPWTLPIVQPLGALNLRAGSLAWSIELALCLAGSIRLLWTMFPKPGSVLRLLCFCFFAPATICLLSGQAALFALLGLVLFLRFQDKAPFFAGVALYLCSTKPHLFLVFGVVLMAWIVVTKKYAVALGAMTAFAASCAYVTARDPAVWREYWHTMTTWGIEGEAIPCLSDTLRLLVKPEAHWLQYVPACAACAWALRYYIARRKTWRWMRQGNLVLLVSVLASPYAWLIDESILLPVIAGLAATSELGVLGVLGVCSAVIDLEVLLGGSMHSRLFLWTAPAWLAIFLYARKAAAEPPLAEAAVTKARIPCIAE